MAKVELVLSPDHYELLRRVLWSAGAAYQAVDGGDTSVLHMADLPPDYRDLMAAVSSARRVDAD